MSVVLHIIFMPPVHFSIFTVQRGTIIVFMAAPLPGIIPGIDAGMLPVMPIDPIIEFIMFALSYFCRQRSRFSRLQEK
jgi:hypothetical protein